MSDADGAERRDCGFGRKNHDTYDFVLKSTRGVDFENYFFHFGSHSHHAGEYQGYIEYFAGCMAGATPRPYAAEGICEVVSLNRDGTALSIELEPIGHTCLHKLSLPRTQRIT
jgi:hypothetical protein